MTEKVALYVSIMNTQARRSHCALARWRIVLPCCLGNVTSYHLLARDCAEGLLSLFRKLLNLVIILGKRTLFVLLVI